MKKKVAEEKAAVEKTIPSQPSSPDEWKVKDAMETLLRAEEIKRDKSLMKEVHKMLDGKHKAITSLKDLRDARDEAVEDDED